MQLQRNEKPDILFMKIELSYADGTIILDLPSLITVDIFKPATVDNPLGFDAFRNGFVEAHGDRFLSGEPLLVVVNDGYRNTPTATILQWLDKLDRNVVDQAYFLIATGIHGAPTEEHYNRIFGPFWNRVRARVSYHDCHDLTSMALLSTDSLGGDVWLNKAVLDYPKILVIGSVEPHYFAGFTGGRKAIFPGLTDFETVARNHNLANSLQAAPLKIKRNPVAEHLDSLMRMLDPRKFFGIQIVTDSKRQTAGIFCGELDSAFTRAASFAEKIYSCCVPQKYNVVLCEILPPLDKNLYQAQKALENSQAAVKDGGEAVIVSACPEGVGSEYFFKLAQNWDHQANRANDGRLHFGSHKLSRVIEIGKRINVYLFSTLPGNVVRQVFYEPLDNLQDFLYSKARECEICNMAVVHDAANMVLKTK
jgi:nickel-dependent lactate racemase